MTSKRPIPAAIAVVIRGDQVLLVERQKSPNAGKWGFPGGKIEWGETVFEAAVRELEEETGVIARAARYLTTVDVILPSSDAHFVLTAVVCDYISGDPIAADDAADAAWMAIDDVLSGVPTLAPNVAKVLSEAIAP